MKPYMKDVTVHVVVAGGNGTKRQCRTFWSKNSAKRYARKQRQAGSLVMFFSTNIRGEPTYE